MRKRSSPPHWSRMNTDFSTGSMRRMSDLVTARLGLRFSPDRWPELARGIAETCAELGVADVEGWVDVVLGGLPTTAQLQALARRLTTGESYFFRQPEVFRHIEEKILPALIKNRRESG